MKTQLFSFYFNFVASSFVCSFLVVSYLSCAFLSAQSEDLIPVDFQFSAGMRSDYVQRGLHYAHNTQDFQARMDIDFGDYSTFSSQFWIHSAIDDDFSEIGGLIEYTKTLDSLTYIFSAGYRELADSVFDSGLEASMGLSYELKPSHFLQGNLLYEGGAEGWYANVEYVHARDWKEKHSLLMKLGLSAVNDYYDAKGWHDAYGSLDYTYTVSDTVSITPYVGFSLVEKGKNRVFGGVWLEAQF